MISTEAVLNTNFRPWKKMLPGEYAAEYHKYGKHFAITVKTVGGCMETWVYLGIGCDVRDGQQIHYY